MAPTAAGEVLADDDGAAYKQLCEFLKSILKSELDVHHSMLVGFQQRLASMQEEQLQAIRHQEGLLRKLLDRDACQPPAADAKAGMLPEYRTGDELLDPTPGAPCQDDNLFDSTPRPLRQETPATHEGGTEPEQSSGVESTFHRLFALKSPTSARQGAFRDLHGRTMLTQAQTKILKHEVYRVEHFYSTEGVFQLLARSNLFQNAVFLLIATNLVYLGIDSRNPDDFIWQASWHYILLENIFVALFVSELAVRFLALSCKANCLKDMWFVFDLLLVVLMILETWITGVIFAVDADKSLTMPTAPLRIWRFFRFLRVLRLARNQPELITIMRGLSYAFKGVMSTVSMIVLVNYATAVLLHTIVKDERTVSDNFGTLVECMWTLLMAGTLMDGTRTTLDELRGVGTVNSTIGVVIFMAYVVLTGFMLLNLLIGVLCEVVRTVKQLEENEVGIKLLREAVFKQLKEWDVDASGTISNEELDAVLASQKARDALQELDIDLEYLRDFRNLISTANEGKELPITKALELMLVCRGDQPATVTSLAVAHRLTHAFIERNMMKPKFTARTSRSHSKDKTVHHTSV